MKYLIWLACLKGFSPDEKRRLLAEHGSPGSVYDSLSGVDHNLDDAERILFNCNACGAYPMLFTDLYTGLCKNANTEELPGSMPLIVYCKGTVKQGCTCGIVGSRRCSEYGRSVALKLGADLAKSGITVISGMAKGVDSHAHMGCINSKGYTAAVLGSGIDICYPAEHRPIYDKIAETGLIISEYPPGTKAASYTFPQRNRIIAYLSDTVIVTEASRKSGSLITADYAVKYGRNLYAVPGRIDTKDAEGCNRLIAEKKAGIFLFESEKEIFGYSEPYTQMSLFDGNEQRFTDSPVTIYLKKNGGRASLSDTASALGLTMPGLYSTLTDLELNDIVEIRGTEIWLQR